MSQECGIVMLCYMSPNFTLKWARPGNFKIQVRLTDSSKECFESLFLREPSEEQKITAFPRFDSGTFQVSKIVKLLRFRFEPFIKFYMFSLCKLAYKYKTVNIIQRVNEIFAIISLKGKHRTEEEVAFEASLSGTFIISLVPALFTYCITCIQKCIGRTKQAIIMNTQNNRNSFLFKGFQDGSRQITVKKV